MSEVDEETWRQGDERARKTMSNHGNFFMGQRIGVHDIESGEITRLCDEAAGDRMESRSRTKATFRKMHFDVWRS
jgi:hypothetical protein